MTIDPEDRFKFGDNWINFLSGISDKNIAEARKSLCEMFETESLKGKSFLDIGSGSGLFSLAAYKLGAKVSSFDFDQQSVSCALELKRRYCSNEEMWVIGKASVLNKDYMNKIGKFDIVYSWGVLHHTGHMWEAIENTISSVTDNGICFISIYNDQGVKSSRWKRIKKLYCSGSIGRVLVKTCYIPYFIFRVELNEVLKGRNPFTVFSRYKNNRGMSLYHDWIDWLGGYPFEVAKPEEIFEYFSKRNFMLIKLKTTLGLGCNEFVFRKISP
jgi:2-polyprenyl-6-hydroxyphenyl methylase/3-demethylubiquinone-9 3-methyltransferase